MEKNGKIHGLSDEQAQALRQEGLGSKPAKTMTRSYKEIFFYNIFSVFNMMNAAIAAALIYVGSAKNCLFMLAVLSNTCIGIIQEIRSKRITDRLTIVNKTSVTLIRSGQSRQADIEELVLGDVIELESGCQVPNDCKVISGGCEVNESLLTGESNPVIKNCGDELLSGSFLVSGKCVCEITAVGDDNYADSILGEVKYVKKTSSEIVRLLKRIITVISVFIVPLGSLLFYNQVTQSHATLQEAVESTAAALIGMIPEGLVLLTSTVFMLGIIRLSKRNVLSQDLYSLESLARVDVICADKTGTVTTGEMTVEKAVPADGFDEKRLQTLLGAFAEHSPDSNATATAMKAAFGGVGSKLVSSCAFSSDRKWSAVTAENIGTVVLGAPTYVLGNDADMSCLGNDAQRFRVTAVAVSEKEIHDYKLPDDLKPAGFVLLRETLRSGVGETFDHFAENGVKIKLISGDDPKTVSRLCSGLFGTDAGCADLSAVSDEDIPKLAEETSIFGRATPKQKKLIVKALKENGHKTAMLGDGVNDVLALKESDCAVAPVEGSAAARNVSQLVLLDSDFSSLRDIVSEGRRSINNLQSSSALFLSKTIFSIVMAIIFIFINRDYPFDPIQMTLVSSLTIGFPSFMLSFIRNDRPLSGSFLRNIIRNSVPAAAANIISVMAAMALVRHAGFGEKELASLCVSALAVTGVVLIIKIYSPLTPLRAFVVAGASGGFVLSFIFFHRFFGLAPVFGLIGWYMVIITIFDLVILSILLKAFSFIPK